MSEPLSLYMYRWESGLILKGDNSIYQMAMAIKSDLNSIVTLNPLIYNRWVMIVFINKKVIGG